jgi:hypothetical protein
MRQPVAGQIFVDTTKSTGSKFWQRLKQAVVMQLQVEAAKAVIEFGHTFGHSFSRCFGGLLE